MANIPEISISGEATHAPFLTFLLFFPSRQEKWFFVVVSPTINDKISFCGARKKLMSFLIGQGLEE